MLIELIKNYKQLKEEERDKIIKDVEFNEKIKDYQNALSDITAFENLNIDEFLEFLQKTNYDKHPLDKVETTLIYIRRNNSFQDFRCQGFFQYLKNHLEYARKDTILLEDYENLLARISKLLNSISNPQIFIEDMTLLVQIIKEFNIDQDKMFNFMIQVNSHNLEVVNNVKENAIQRQKDEEKNVVSTNQEDYLKKYGFEIEFSNLEKNIIERNSKENLEEKLKFLSETLEFSFLKDKDYRQLLVVLLGYAPLENIENIYEISIKHDISLKDILPTFYLNIDFKADNIADEVYQSLVGSYEHFINNIKMLESLRCDIKEWYQESVAFFMSPNKLLKDNLQAFKTYGITLNNKNTSLVKALMTKDIKTQLDRFIEAELYGYVLEYPSVLLNKDKAFFHRIYYAKQNGLPVKRRYLISEITSLNGYGINEDNYLTVVNQYTSNYFNGTFFGEINDNNEIEPNTPFNNLIKTLDENYLLVDNIYYIANTHISRQKVLRVFQGVLNRKNENPNYFEGILFAILNGLIIDKEKFDDIVLEVVNLYLINSYIYYETAVNICKKLDIDYNKILAKLNSQERMK